MAPDWLAVGRLQIAPTLSYRRRMTKAEDLISLSSLRSTCHKWNGLPPAKGWRCDSAQLKRPSVRRLWRRFVTSRGSSPLTRLLDQTGKEPNDDEKTLAGNAVRVANRIIDHASATRPGSVDGLRPYRLHSARQVRNQTRSGMVGEGSPLPDVIHERRRATDHARWRAGEG